MPYLANTPQDQRQMLDAIGAASIDELFAAIPAELRLPHPLRLPDALSEMELTHHMTQLAARNDHAGSRVCFLGGGSYDHFVPAVVDALAGRSEFYTSYTPYQPEVSQGNLQAMFEYQTMICQLTGMDVSNASLYDGGSAAAEAALMAISVTRRTGSVVVPETLHPEYREILKCYLQHSDAELVTVPCPDGRLDPLALQAAVDQQAACVVVQHPNFFGGLEAVRDIAGIVHQAGALLIVAVDPISLGILRRPGDLGADIVVAEGQGLGNPLAFGGPYLGILACRESFVRRLPGRLAGQTVDQQGRRCWVLTMQTREQHIRRDKATSNICTNQGLLALRASIYLALAGPEGLREVATLCVQKAHYAASLIGSGSRLELPFATSFFKEFVVRDKQGQVQSLLAEALAQGYLAGVPLGRWYPQLDDCLLIAVTEQRTRSQIDGLARCFASSRIPEMASHA
jgi:glycine dehydrogenase subunit 1